MSRLVTPAKLAVIFMYALAALLYWSQGRYQIAHNLTDSIDGDLFLIRLKDEAAIRIGDKVAFTHDGAQWGLPSSATWVKKVAGLPGDLIAIGADDEVAINGKKTSLLDRGAMQRANLTPNINIEVPDGHLYVTGDHAASLDSRYQEFGFVAKSRVIGKVTRIW